MISVSGKPADAPSQIPADRGLLGWTQPPVVLTGSTAMPTAGLLSLRLIRRVRAAPVTNIITYVGAAGTSLTAGQCFAALFRSNGSLVAQTADQATAWASTGMKTMALAAGPHALDAGDYYVGAWFNGTTGPAFARSGTIFGALTNVGLAAPNFEMATTDAGVTTTAPSTFGTQTASVFEWWFALS